VKAKRDLWPLTPQSDAGDEGETADILAFVPREIRGIADGPRPSRHTRL